MTLRAAYAVGDMSPSLLYNNLSCIGTDNTCVFASGTHVCCARAGTSKAEALIQMNSAVLCVRAVSLTDQAPTRPLILAASSTQCLLLNGNQTVCGFDELYASGAFGCCCDVKTAHSARGLVAHMVVGSTNGGVLYAEAFPNAAATGGVLVSKSTLQRSHEGVRVTAVAVGTPGSPRELAAVTGDGNGRVLLWTSGDQGTAPAPYSMIPSAHESDCVTSLTLVTGEPTMSVESPNVAVAVGYGCGKVRVYGIAVGDLRFEICAHAKWVNAIQYCPMTGFLATTGEDSVVQVFSVFGNPSAEDAKFVVSGNVANGLPTGVAFSANGRVVMVAAFNMPSLYSLQV